MICCLNVLCCCCLRSIVMTHFTSDKKQTYFHSSVCSTNGKLTIKMTLTLTTPPDHAPFPHSWPGDGTSALEQGTFPPLKLISWTRRSSKWLKFRVRTSNDRRPAVGASPGGGPGTLTGNTAFNICNWSAATTKNSQMYVCRSRKG